jgi:hypothetical protein
MSLRLAAICCRAIVVCWAAVTSGLFVSIAVLIRATRPESVEARLFAVASEVLPFGVSSATWPSIALMNVVLSDETVCAASDAVELPLLTLARAESRDVTHEVALLQ